MIPVRRYNRRRALLAITVTITPLLSAAQNAGVDSFSEEIVVTANRGPRQALDLVGNHRYFPGQQREVYVQLGYHTQ